MVTEVSRRSPPAGAAKTCAQCGSLLCRWRKTQHTIVVCGAGGVGKSALLVQLLSRKFIYDYDPTLEATYYKSIAVGGSCAELELCEIAGQNVVDENWLFAATLKRADGVLLVYDVTDPSTLVEACRTKETIEKILKEFPGGDSQRTLPFLLVGNKTDLDAQRRVSAKEGRRAALQCGSYFDESSARAGHRDIDRSVSLLIHMMRVRNTPTSNIDTLCALPESTHAHRLSMSQALRRASVVATIPASRSFGPEMLRLHSYSPDDSSSQSWKKRSHENIGKSRRFTDSVRLYWCRLQLRLRGQSPTKNETLAQVPKEILYLGRKTSLLPQVRVNHF